MKTSASARCPLPRILFAAAVLLTGMSGRAAEAADRGLWLCVGPEELLKAAEPLRKLRAGQGWKTVMTSGPVPAAVAAQSEKPRAVLILGDDSTAAESADAAWRVAADRRPYHGWDDNHPAEFVSDAAWGDFDGDGLPDVPVGRIPAQTPRGLNLALAKILKWESRTPGPEDLRLPVWMGDPGFGKHGDFLRNSSISFLFGQFTARAPAWAAVWLLQADPRSPFCGWPEQQADVFNSQFAGGGLLSAMIGHGRTGSWWIMDTAGKTLRYGADNARRLAGDMPAAPHVFFACLCGSFADPARRCLAEEMLFAPGGPVACIGASVDSHPLTNYYGATALLDEAGQGAADTFGALWIQSIRRAHSVHEADKERLVAVLEPLIIGKTNKVADLKADHLLIYNLLGDPATRMFFPQPLSAVVSREGNAWRWKAEKPAGTTARLLVQHRIPMPDFQLGTPASDPAAAAQNLAEANESLAFRTLEELSADASWEGTVGEPGTLRLVAVGGPQLLVHAEPLKTP